MGNSGAGVLRGMESGKWHHLYRKALSGAIDIQGTGPAVMCPSKTLGLGNVTVYMGSRGGNHDAQAYQTIIIILLRCLALNVLDFLIIIGGPLRILLN